MMKGSKIKVHAEIPGTVDESADPLDLFRQLLPRREITPLLGKLAFDVLKIFDVTPMLLVDEPRLQFTAT
jgi:hypothetical protein